MLENYNARAELAKIKDFTLNGVDSDGVPIVWMNTYYCESCELTWSDSWSCQCDDQCPDCGKSITPESSIWIGPESEALKSLWAATALLEGTSVGDAKGRPALDQRELATVLAALRYWQRLGLAHVWQEDDPIAGVRKGQAWVAEGEVASNSGTLTPLTVEEIDALCERINL